MTKITADASYGRASIQWEDEKAGRRYHVWVDDNYSFIRGDHAIHSNPINRDPNMTLTHEDRRLDRSSERWAPIVADVIARAKADDLIAKSYAKKQAAARAGEIRLKLQSIPVPQSPALNYIISHAVSLSDDDLLTLAGAFR